MGSTLRAAIGILVVGTVLVGCAQPDSGPGASDLSQPGWTELPVSPLPPGLVNPFAFWTGSELIVAGGYEFSDEVNLTMYSETYSYNVESGQWRELTPLEVPGYDGVQAVSGSWLGSAWIGAGFPCRSGVSETGFELDSCDPSAVGLRWTPEDGWSSEFIRHPPEAVRLPDGTIGYGFGMAGLSSAGLVLTTYAGVFTHSGEAAPRAWEFRPWPAGTEPLYGTAAGLVEDTLITISSNLPPTRQSEAQSLQVNVLPVEQLTVQSSRALADVDQLPIPYCQPGQALFVYPTPQMQTLRVEPEQTIVMATPRPDEGGAYVNIDSIDVGSGVVELGADTLYLDTRTGEVTRLQPASTMQVAVWTGEILIGLADRSDMWFAFRPAASGWAESGDLAFPYPVLGE